MILGDEANTTVPRGRWVIQDIIELETRRVVVEKSVEFGLEKDVLVVYICVNETDGGWVCRVLEGSTNNLHHGSDASTACDHANVLCEVGGVDEVAFWALDADPVANFEKGEVF
jgi:hypothetical protein